MKNEKTKFTAEFKVNVLMEQLGNQIPFGKICDQYNLISIFLSLEEGTICRGT